MALLPQGTAVRACSLLALVISACVFSQAQTSYPGADDTTATLGKASDHAETTLTVSATDTDTVFTVADATKFEVDDLITFCIGTSVPGLPCTDSGEKARVSAVTATAPGTITVSARNVAGSAAQNHATGDTVHCTITSPYHNFLVDAIAATQAKLDTITAGAGGYYQFVQDNGVSATQRSKLNLIPGAGITLACPDNSGAGSTDCTISAPGATGTGTNWQTLEVGAVSQTASPTENLIAGTGIAIVGVHNSGTDAADITISATGSGAGTKAAFAPFVTAGCGGSGVGTAVDVPATGGATAVNHTLANLLNCTDDFTSGTNQIVQFHFPLPGDFTHPSTVAVQLNWFSSAGSGSSTSWSVKTVCPAATGAVLTGTITFNAAGTATTVNNVTPFTPAASVISGIAATGCLPGYEQYVQIQRTDSAVGVVSLVSASVALQRTY